MEISEVFASGSTAAGLMQLQPWWRHDRASWDWNPGAVLPGSDRVILSSVPAFIQSSFRTGSGAHGNYEVLAPSVEGGLLHWHYDFGLWGDWRSDRAINPDGPQVTAVHMIQSDFGARHNNFEVVAETGESGSADGPGIGYGTLLFYWCNNDRATNSDDGIWGAPSPLPF